MATPFPREFSRPEMHESNILTIIRELSDSENPKAEVNTDVYFYVNNFIDT